ncbi:MAG: L-threonylcarbamoyladenylate synthase [Pyrinomonadaceae bacterium]
MKTELTGSPAIAAHFIKTGGIVAFPTETVYGLGADVFNEVAVARIFDAKRRPADNPLIAHISSVDQIAELAAEITNDARLLLDRFFPGPLTLVLKKTARVPMNATAGLDTIGVRMPDSDLANEFLSLCDTPVVAPSANISGRPSPTTWQAVYDDLNGRIDCILQGDQTEVGLESTVVDCVTSPPMILRPGAISLESLRAVVAEIRMHNRDTLNSPRSPGLRHTHYAPKAAVIIIDSASDVPEDSHAGFIGLERPPATLAKVLVCSSTEDYARAAFAFFRDCDKAGVQTIYCQQVEEAGIGTALMDRLRRAVSR